MQKTIPALALAGMLVVAPVAFGHGFAGKRFFPATLNIEDSFVAPELDFLVTQNREDGNYVTEFETEFAKPLTRKFQLSIGSSYVRMHPPGGPRFNGFDNVEVGAKFQAFIHDEAESALAIGLDVDMGGTGSRRIGAESFSVVSPAVYYSKGFGNASTSWLRPFAITTAVAATLPTNGAEPKGLDWGFTVQYSLPYLEDFVKDTGLRAPFRNVIPVVEFPLHTCLEGACSGETTGTINPGLMWIGKYSQLGFELVLPVNDRSGSHVGFQLQYHLYLDDIIPSWKVRR